MQKIKKNLTAIQSKFQSLKATNKQYEEQTPIGQVAQIMTYGVIQQKEVQLYLKHINESTQIDQKQKVQTNWYQMNIQQMILFLDKVIKYRNINKPKRQKKERLNIGQPIKRKKTKKKNSDTHQNPYIPSKIHVSGKGQEIPQGQNPIQQNQGQNFRQNYISGDSDDDDSYQYSQQKYESGLSSVLESSQQSSFIQTTSTKPQLLMKKKKISKQELLGLPANIKTLPVNERHRILTSRYKKVKTNMQSKFNTIYKFYKKQMYIPNQSFQKNNDLMMDLRIFLKYYKQFELNNQYKASQMTKHFKKVALNGLWLDYQQFITLHYNIIELLELSEDFNTTEDAQKAQDFDNAELIKNELVKNIKLLMQNLTKLKDLSDVLSDEKIKKILKNKSDKQFVKKIVETHSGLNKQDVMQKLQQRNAERNKRTSNILNCKLLNTQGNEHYHSLSPIKGTISPVRRQTNSYGMSIYNQLQIPKLRSRELKNSSIYSSLQLLNMFKQKQKLRMMINEQENELYLDQYFKKEKLLSKLTNSSSSILLRKDSENSVEKFSLKPNNSIKGNSTRLKSNYSLPRMKFT